MKKIITISIVGVLLITAFGAVAESNSVLKINDNNEEKRDYTHTVFIEVGTGQFCGPCHSWNTALFMLR